MAARLRRDQTLQRLSAMLPELRSRFDVREFLEDAFGSRVDLVTHGALRERLRSRIETEVLHVA